MVETAIRDLKTIEAEINATKEALLNVKGSDTEVYARIVGYYRSVRNWNKGKRDEYNHRKMFIYNGSEESQIVPNVKIESQFQNKEPINTTKTESTEDITSFECFIRKTCPNCPPVKEYLINSDIMGKMIDVDTPEGLEKASQAGVFAAPTVILYNKNGVEISRAHSIQELTAILNKVNTLVC